MQIVFDLDNTLVDEFGATLRPGVRALLDRLRAEGHVLHLWTHSRRARAVAILRDHRLRGYFTTRTFREDYDPEAAGARKDIRRVGGELLVDDDPEEVAHVRALGLAAFQVRPHRKRSPADPAELAALARFIERAAGWRGRLARWRAGGSA